MRTAVRDTVLPRGGGPDGLAPLFVPKDTPVRWSSHSLHRRKDVYGEDADEFRPERWEGSLRPLWSYVPFSGGPRFCPGQQLALTQLSYLLVRLFQAFESIEACDALPMRLKIGTGSSLVDGCWRLHATVSRAKYAFPFTFARPRSLTHAISRAALCLFAFSIPLTLTIKNPLASSETAQSDSRSLSRGRNGRAGSEDPLAGNTKIVVERLSKTINEDHLYEIFGIYGRITDLDLPINRSSNTNRGTAYILFERVEDAESAVAHLHEAQLVAERTSTLEYLLEVAVAVALQDVAELLVGALHLVVVVSAVVETLIDQAHIRLQGQALSVEDIGTEVTPVGLQTPAPGHVLPAGVAAAAVVIAMTSATECAGLAVEATVWTAANDQ
ncbi:uncharacterized protein J7T54_003585 [Emericellopsis cladophorae]|uniref:RRM domain-containing protein n=1 Tax=Emericellopsis cladophorae TaxID=2686198 RepID=A0A9P9Y3R2_9HYPO|nr:uncharacterized protein J7T54_003585 [Emericellopsis cladophorae]KAI6782573.1 hypothetical protein J7T54_003585 [Emericellopsis cladophorae]